MCGVLLSIEEPFESDEQRHAPTPRGARDWTHWDGVVGRLPATFCAAHDDCVCRGSPAESFEIPYLVILAAMCRKARTWRYRFSGVYVFDCGHCGASAESKRL